MIINFLKTIFRDNPHFSHTLFSSTTSSTTNTISKICLPSTKAWGLLFVHGRSICFGRFYGMVNSSLGASFPLIMWHNCIKGCLGRGCIIWLHVSQFFWVGVGHCWFVSMRLQASSINRDEEDMAVWIYLKSGNFLIKAFYSLVA